MFVLLFHFVECCSFEMFDCFADFENIESIVAVVAELEFGDVEI